MLWVGRGLLGLLVLALVAGCTVKQQDPTVAFEAAQRRVVALVDDTLAAALPSLRLGQPRVGRQPCHDAFGRPSQRVHLDFERSFPIQGRRAERLVADTERIWRAHGYVVERYDSFPEVAIRRVIVDGYVMALDVDRTDKQARLVASSPCIRPPS